MELLKKLRLVRAGKPTRAAILLFGRDPQGFYIQARLKIGRFRDETLIVDDRRIEGTLFEQVEGAIGYFREKLDTRFEMTGRPQRDVIWEYPLKALREAVTNAICHRNYASARDTEVRIYDREVMVWNDGGLPDELSVQSLKKTHPSVPRNRQVAEIFYYAGMIEQWGGGTRMIINECKAAGMPEPVFEQVHGFRVTFRKAARPAGIDRQAPDKHPTSTRQVRIAEFLRHAAIHQRDFGFLGVEGSGEFHGQAPAPPTQGGFSGHDGPRFSEKSSSALREG